MRGNLLFDFVKETNKSSVWLIYMRLGVNLISEGLLSFLQLVFDDLDVVWDQYLRQMLMFPITHAAVLTEKHLRHVWAFLRSADVVYILLLA